jgi:hypothetical protein
VKTYAVLYSTKIDWSECTSSACTTLILHIACSTFVSHWGLNLTLNLTLNITLNLTLNLTLNITLNLTLNITLHTFSHQESVTFLIVVIRSIRAFWSIYLCQLWILSFQLCTISSCLFCFSFVYQDKYRFMVTLWYLPTFLLMSGGLPLIR